MTPEQTAHDILSLLLTPWNVLLMVAVWTIIQTVRRVAPSMFAHGTVLARLLPVAPVVLCQIAVWIPGPWVSEATTAMERVVLGTVIGACTSNLHAVLSKLGLQSILKLDVKH
jgi:hypothetical protein